MPTATVFSSPTSSSRRRKESPRPPHDVRRFRSQPVQRLPSTIPSSEPTRGWPSACPDYRGLGMQFAKKSWQSKNPCRPSKKLRRQLRAIYSPFSPDTDVNQNLHRVSYVMTAETGIKPNQFDESTIELTSSYRANGQ